jgi:hydroxymethylpyrimidine/phosphomethylpyrimidine kinase
MDRPHGEMAVTGMPDVLVVAGSDCSGGAGIVRDIETLAAFGVKASVAITAVTIQTHHGVEHVDAVSPERVAGQMRAALKANPIAAIKIGMLATAGTIRAVDDMLADHPALPVVLDPVLASSSGRALLTEDAMEPLLRLFRRCALITPNLPELALLSGAASTLAPLEQAKHLVTAGAPAVLVKGGHSEGPASADILVRPDRDPYSFTAPRLAVSMRGTGCMLASAVAARLSLGDDLETAIASAKSFVHERLREMIANTAPGSIVRLPGLQS